MDKLSRSDERGLVQAVEQSIRLTHQGETPNNAIAKIASQKRYGPEHIRRMAEAYNKSKSVHVLKTARSEDRSAPFELANADVILGSVYTAGQKTAAAACSTPKRGASYTPSKQKQKQKSRVGRVTVDAQVVDRLTKQAARDHKHVCDRVDTQLRLAIQKQKLAFDRAIDDLVEHTAPMSSRDLQKVAQFVINGYPTTGPNLLGLLGHRLRRELPDLQKTANGVVYNKLEPYLTISRVYDAAQKMASAEIALADFQAGLTVPEDIHAEEPVMRMRKEAETFLGSLAANTLANMAAGVGSAQGAQQAVRDSKKKIKSVEEDLDPLFYNRLKGHDTKRTFTTLALYDPELKQYDTQDLIRAYNDAVKVNPEVYRNEGVLRNVMINNLHSHGIKDLSSLKQELEIGKALTAEEVFRDKLRRDAVKPEKVQAPLVPVSPGTGKPGALRQTINDGLDRVTESAQELMKPQTAEDLKLDPGKVRAVGGIGGVLSAISQYERQGWDSLSDDDKVKLTHTEYVVRGV